MGIIGFNSELSRNESYLCHAKWCCLVPRVLLILVLWRLTAVLDLHFISKFSNISVEIWAFLQGQKCVEPSLPFLLVQYVALRPSQCEDFHTEHCLVWGFNVVYLMHMCFFRIILGVCLCLCVIVFMRFHLCITDSNFVQFRTIIGSIAYSILKCVYFFFSYLKFDCYCCTLFGKQCNCPGVTHTVFSMPVCLILGSLMKDKCCMLTVGMLVLKANFIHIKFLKCLIQNVLQNMYL
jgi:hypothetical protein